MIKHTTYFKHFAGLCVAVLAMAAPTACDDNDMSSASDPAPTDTSDPGNYNPAPIHTPIILATGDAPAGDEAPSSNIAVAAQADGSYTLSIDGNDPGDIYVFTRPLEADLATQNVCLTFMYRTEAQIPRFSLSYYSAAAAEPNGPVSRGEIQPSASVDRDADGWAVARFVISADLTEFDWGHTGDRLKIWLRPDQSAACTMQIKNIYLESTDIAQGDSGSGDDNTYQLTFTPGRGAWWQMENAYGIYAGVSFSRNRNTYLLIFGDAYNDNGTALEHFIGSDPLTRVLSYDNTNKIEVQFKYRADADWTLRTGLYPFESPASDWPASIRDSKVPASASAETDKDGWASFSHDITTAVRAKSWGRSVEGKDQQIRFTFQAADGTPHPEQAGLSQLELKDVCIVVRERDASEMDVIDLKLELPGYRTPDLTSMTESEGEYDINFNGEFPKQEYEMFISELPEALDPNKDYYLQFEYICEEEINSFQILYFSKNGGGDNEWADGKVDMVPSEEWTRATVSLSDRSRHGNWGAAAGQVLRPHFYDIPGRTTTGEPNFGKPLHVKVRNFRIVSF